MNKSPEDSIIFPCGLAMKNRFMLSPMTNTQSFEDGRLSEDELRWLTMRAEGQFGLVMTCASHVQFIGKGFPGQLGIYSDSHIEGHKVLSSSIKSHGSLAVIQLHHAGMRSPAELIHQKPVCPSDNKKFGARALSLDEVYTLRDDFIQAAIRAKESGYDGVEIHGAHGYILAQFISQVFNKRTDEYGGSLMNRARLLFEIVGGIRKNCGDDFLMGVRLSPEKYGIAIEEIQEICQTLIADQKIDFLDISLWNYRKLPEQDSLSSKSLLEYFTELDYGNVLLTIAGDIRNGMDVIDVLDKKVDFVGIGRSAILHHDFPFRVMADRDFVPTVTPVSEAYLRAEGLSDKFITYMRRWPNFVAGDAQDDT